MSTINYVVTDPEDSPREFATWDEALAHYESVLEQFREVAIHDGWHEDINQLRILQVVADTVECNRRDRPEDLDEDGFSESTGDHWPDADWDWICDYDILDRRADRRAAEIIRDILREPGGTDE